MTTAVVVDGVTLTTTASPWTPEDRALMLAWTEYQGSLCKGCGHPKATAWHPYSEGWFEVEETITCWGCTVAKERNDDGTYTPVTFAVVVDTRDHDADPLPPYPIT